MKVIVIAVLLGTALMLTGCTDSQRQMITQVAEPDDAIQPGEPEDAGSLGPAVLATEGDDEGIPVVEGMHDYTLSHPTRQLVMGYSCEFDTWGEGIFPDWRIFVPCADSDLRRGDEGYIIAEFAPMDDFPHVSRIVSFEFNIDEIHVLNTGAYIAGADGTIAEFIMDEANMVVVHFRYLGTERDTVVRNNLQPDEIEFVMRVGTTNDMPGLEHDIRIKVL